MNIFKKARKGIPACCVAIYIAFGGVFSAHADSWNSVVLGESLQIDKITPGRDGAYFLSGDSLSYWEFQSRTHSFLNIGQFYYDFLDCELTREGYLAAGFAYGNIAYFSGSELLTGFGSGAVEEHGLDFMDIVVTGEDSLAFFFYEGAYRVTGEKYTHLEAINGPFDPWWFMCNGHRGTFWAGLRLPDEVPECLIERIDQNTTSPDILLEGAFRGIYCDSADTLWIATSLGLYWVPSDVTIGPQPGPFDPPVYPEELVLCPSYPGPPPTSVVCDTAGRTLVGTDGDGLYLYEDGAWTHITAADGIADMSVRCVGVDPDNYFFAAGTGWFSFEKKTPDAVGEDQRIVPFTVHSPYPNPANAAVTIGYTLDHDAQVRIDIFNILGQKARELIETRMTAGFHQSTFTTNDMASGLYLIHIDAGGFHSFAKVTVMK